MRLKHLPKTLRNLILPIIFLSLVSLILAVNSFQKGSGSHLTLTSRQNKFELNFKIEEYQQPQFAKILQNLDLPASVYQGVEFELDSTTSAKLNFFLPAAAKLDISPKSVAFKGSVDHSNLEDLQMEDFKLPPTTHLAIFASDFKDYLYNRFNLPQEFRTWLDQNEPKRGQYMIIFGDNNNLGFIFKANSINLESLQELQIKPHTASIYKKEQSQGVDFHLLNLDEGKPQPVFNPTFFQIGQFIFMASSYEAAQELLEAQKSPARFINFTAKEKNPVSFYVHFINKEEYPIGDDFAKLATSRDLQTNKVIKKIDEFRFALKDRVFSGLINLK